MRLPIGQIQTYLLTLHGVRISSGEIVELLHRLKDQMQPHLDALKRKIRASPAVLARLFIGLITAYLAADPKIMGDDADVRDVHEGLSLEHFHVILDRTFALP